MRERRKDEGLDFTAMAKVVGIEWQSLTAAERAKFENEANANKEAYIADLTEYRRTEQFAEYRQYVAEFKQKQGTKPVSPSSFGPPLTRYYRQQGIEEVGSSGQRSFGAHRA